MSEHTAPGKFGYTLSRDLEATATQVFAAWTEPARYEQWSGAAPGSVKLDPRPGGAWSAEMVTPDGQRFPLTGSYLEVEQDRRLVVGMDVAGRPGAAVMTVTIDEQSVPGRTRITVTQDCDSQEERDSAEQGSGMLLDSLTAYLTGK